MMKTSGAPRIVIVTRQTQIDQIKQTHGTLEQARFLITRRAQSISREMVQHKAFIEAINAVSAAIPNGFRRAHVQRSELDRFLFEPDDTIIVIGQDGLVPNTAKYLNGQLVVGINPSPDSIDGVLCRHRPDDAPAIFNHVSEREGARFQTEIRTMVEAVNDDGQTILALNEVFVGHRTHQSARYLLHVSGKSENQSSSGLICCTGTGATGWARSIATQRGIPQPLPHPQDGRLAWFVREPFPSIATGTSLDFGLLQPGETLRVLSEMGENGVVFADGIESDYIPFLAKSMITLRASKRTLNLLVPAKTDTHDAMSRQSWWAAPGDMTSKVSAPNSAR